jgi:hypothetical protein
MSMKEQDPNSDNDGAATPSNAREHQQVFALLPWLINGTASPEQRLRATAHLAGCEDCRQEYQAQRLLRQALHEQPPRPAVDAEAGLLRLLDRLDAPAEEQPLPPSREARPARREVSRLTMALAVAVVVQSIGLGALGLGHLGSVKDGGGGDYRTLSQQQAAPATHARLQVIPDASMSMADWRRLLEAHGLRVVDGPNAAGAYALALSDGASAPSMDALLAHLRATPGVRLAEPVAPLP